MKKIVGTVEEEQSEGYLVDTQNTSLYLVRCLWRAERGDLGLSNVPMEACASCHWEVMFQDRFCPLALVFTCVVLFLSHRWVQPTAQSHLPPALAAVSSGAVCLPRGSLTW